MQKLDDHVEQALAQQQDEASSVPQPSKSQGDHNELSRAKVQEEIDSLKRKLQQRRLRNEETEGKSVAVAKERVTQCLRLNDRRPLDCWQEVEQFRREVDKVEAGFLGQVLD